MTYDELYEIMKKNQTTPDKLEELSLPCPILADMIEDTADIIPPSPKEMEMIREAMCLCHVSTPQNITWSEMHYAFLTDWHVSTVYTGTLFLNRLLVKKDKTACFIFYVYKKRS